MMITMNISVFTYFFAHRSIKTAHKHARNGVNISLLSSLFFFSILSAHAINSASETRWAEQLRDNIVIGEPLDLPLSSTEKQTEIAPFFSIYTEATTSKAKGAVILLHGSGAHPDWSDIIHPLRVTLPDNGWASLAIQLPLQNTEKPSRKEEQNKERIAVIKASITRINLAIEFLREKKYDYIVLISHSFGSLMSLNYLQTNSDKKTAQGKPFVNAAIIIGTPLLGKKIPLNSALMIAKIHIPLLDLYGSEDLDSVLRSAKARKTAAHKAQNKHYRQAQTIGANHFYQGLDNELNTYVSNWLNSTYRLSKP